MQILARKQPISFFNCCIVKITPCKIPIRAKTRENPRLTIEELEQLAEPQMI